MPIKGANSKPLTQKEIDETLAQWEKTTAEWSKEAAKNNRELRRIRERRAKGK